MRGSEPDTQGAFVPDLKTEKLGEKAGVLKDINTEEVREKTVSQKRKRNKQEQMTEEEKESEEDDCERKNKG